MTRVVDDGTHDGRLSLWIRLRYGLAWTSILGWLITAAALLTYGAARAYADHDAPVVGLAFGAVVFVAIGLTTVLARPGVRVTRRDQPDLVDLVETAATRAGLTPPPRIWLTHTTQVAARVRPWSRGLQLGWALPPALPAAELSALVAHELAMAQYGGAMTLRLSRQWSAAAFREHDPGTPRRYLRRARDLRPLGEAVHMVADAAAISAAGRQAAARATVPQLYIYSEFGDCMDALLIPRRWFRRPTVIEDLDDAWRVRVAHGVPLSLRGPDDAQFLDDGPVREHPGLASALRALAGAELSLASAASGPPVPMRPLTRRGRRLLVRRLRAITTDSIRWFTAASAPAQWWTARAAAAIVSVNRDVARVLGRPPVDAYESAEVLILRNREVLIAAGEDPSEVGVDETTHSPADDEPYCPPPVLASIVEDALLRRGWHIVHPALPGVLIGPDGARFDALRSVTGSADHPDLSALRAILRPEDPAAQVRAAAALTNESSDSSGVGPAMETAFVRSQ